jgi:hypothetical protein
MGNGEWDQSPRPFPLPIFPARSKAADHFAIRGLYWSLLTVDDNRGERRVTIAVPFAMERIGEGASALGRNW